MTFRAAASRFLFAVCLAVTAASPRAARADDDATTEMARQRFREGVGYYDKLDYEKARLAFLQAYALKPHPSILLNLAQSELRGGRSAEAANHFTEYLKTNTEASKAERQEAELGLAAAKSKVGEVNVNVDANGAQVTVDGEDKGTSPLAGPLFLLPGAHTIDAKMEDKHASKSVTAAAGQTANVNLSLKAGAAAAAPPPPAAAGASEEAEPAEKEPAEEAEPAEPAAGTEANASAEASTGGRKNFFNWWVHSPVAIAGTVVGGVGVALGVTFAALAHKDYANADSYKSDILTQWNALFVDPGPPSHPNQDSNLFPSGTLPCALPDNAAQVFMAHGQGQALASDYANACKKFSDAKNAGDTKKTIAIVSGVVGGVALVGTVVYYFIDPNAKDSAAAQRGFQARIVPMTSTGHTGLSVVGAF